MINYQILIEYIGDNFVGWQIQKNGLSVQETIQNALKKITKKKILIFGSGRTDAGVHAIEQSAHFKIKNKIKDKKKFLKSLNFFLSKKNISILDIKERKKLFHARHSAKKREYRYYIVNRQASLSLERNRVWYLTKKLNLNLMKKGAKILKNTKDFSTCRASSCSARSPIKTLQRVKITKIRNKIEIIFISKSFLQQQVRSMVGCLKYLAEEKWSIKKFKEVLNSKDRKNCAPPAPAYGLYLFKVSY
ncbi:tRNA pseudouridine(38-40) synthase TruA [Pelagibacteraceae bacterium]|nr:tRNA pseudouridine(38-40) synthase TruA [Pelagibacteraceae bacterium]